MSMITKEFMLLVLLITIVSNFTLVAHAEDKMEKALRVRIEGAYKAYKERNFKELLSYSGNENNNKEAKEKRIAEMDKMFPILVAYKIKEIKIDGNRAKVKVRITVVLDNIKDVSDSYDYWLFQNNDWRLLDFGKIE